MRCTRAEKFLPLYVAGDLAARRAPHVANHLANCERCRVIAEEYEESRNLVRAATLPPAFDNAFYEEIRRSVLAEIKRGHKGFVPPPARFSFHFNARFAYAASLALMVATVVAFVTLSFHNYADRISEKAAREGMFVNVSPERAGTPSAKPVATPAIARGERQKSYPFKESTKENAEVTMRTGSRAAKPSGFRRHANNGKAANEMQRSADLAKYTLSRARRNLLAPIDGATTKSTEEIARADGGTHDAREVSRIEIQTSDPNIRIIWLSPKPDAVAQPLK